MANESASPLRDAARALHTDDAPALRALLQRYPELKALINEPRAEQFDSQPILHVRSRAMLDVLLEAGADLNAKSRWWAGGFGLLHLAPLEVARYAIERGAVVDAHAAARLGLLDTLRPLIEANPALVHARGGDGQTPLHFASTVEIAAFLLDHGADINARDIDHESTPAQHMIRDRQEVVRYLVQRGCQTDLLLAAALGDLDLARRHLEANPDSIRLRVSEGYFPMINPRAGGTIYQWTLGWHVSPYQVARQFGHAEMAAFLRERSPADVRLLGACWAGDEAEVKALLQSHPGIAATLPPDDQRQIAHAARNDDLPALRLMLEAGLPVTARGQHNATPLHWACWHGNAEAVALLLQRHPPIEDVQNDYRATPLGWAIHGSENGWHRERGNYAATVELLLQTGAAPPEQPGGTAAVREALRRRA